MYRIAVVGATGYTGFELLRLLASHGGVEVGALTSETYSGREIGEVFPALAKIVSCRLQKFEPEVCEGADIVFCCLPHRTAMNTVPGLLDRGFRVVDFSADFFGRPAFLTVSGQLNVEAYCLALSKVYTFSPTFRAENSNTSRHLSEFWMMEPEIAFADLNDDADLAEEMLKYVFRAVLDERPDDMAFFNQRIMKGCVERLEKIVDSNFVRMEYTEAIETLKNSKKKFEFTVEWGSDLQSEHERYLTEEHAGRPVVVVNYPREAKAFYMRLNDDEKTVAAMDVLVPGVGEIIGGSQREERLDYLDRRIDEMDLPKDDYWWYRDLRKYGTVPHAGFGLGFARLINYVTGIANIRDVVPFPRTPNSAEF